MTIEEKREVSRKVLEGRFLTQEEFMRIDSEQIRRAANKAQSSSKLKKSKEEAGSVEKYAIYSTVH